MGHFIKKCSGCDRVLTQCRCASEHKAVQYGWCEDCRPAPELKQPIGEEDLFHGSAEINPAVLPSVLKLAALALESRNLPNHGAAIRQGADELVALRSDLDVSQAVVDQQRQRIEALEAALEEEIAKHPETFGQWLGQLGNLRG